MFRLTGFFTLVLALIAVAPPAVPAAPPAGITVMTRNLYFGADFTPILQATNLPGLIGAASAVFATVQASRPADRLDAIAGEIARKQPDLVGLQEVTLWRSGPTPPPGSPPQLATTVEFDFLDLLLAALAQRGHPYVVVAITANFDAQVPAFVGGAPRMIRYSDFDVILARADAGLSFANHKTENFVTNAEILNPLTGPLTILRGYASVAVTRGSDTFRFVNTHLDPLAPAVRLAQANEILNEPGNPTLPPVLPLVLVCDCNTAANGIVPDATAAYDALIQAGLTDAWSEKHPGK